MGKWGGRSAESSVVLARTGVVVVRVRSVAMVCKSGPLKLQHVHRATEPTELAQPLAAPRPCSLLLLAAASSGHNARLIILPTSQQKGKMSYRTTLLAVLRIIAIVHTMKRWTSRGDTAYRTYTHSLLEPCRVGSQPY